MCATIHTPDTEGTECKMRMNFKIKPETPAGSAAASGCTPRPLGVTCSSPSALRETLGKGGRKTLCSRKVLSLSQKAPGTAHGIAHLPTCSDFTWTRNHCPSLSGFPSPHPTSHSHLWPAGLGLYLDPDIPQPGTLGKRHWAETYLGRSFPHVPTWHSHI